MRIVCLSDTHIWHNGLKLPKADMIIHAGDFSGMGSMHNFMEFLHWFNYLDYKYKVFIAGNHDEYIEQNPKSVETLLKGYPDIVYLQDTMKTVGGLKIYGSPWSPIFRDWSFMLERGQEIKTKWDKIPGGLDILITHSPAYGYLDSIDGKTHLGCEELAKVIERVKPRVHVCGHIHSGNGIIKNKNKDIIRVNGAICDEQYNPIQKCRVITIDKDIGK